MGFEHISKKGRLGDDADDAGVFKNVGDLIGLEQKIDRDRARAESNQGKERHHELGTVAHDEPKIVSGLNASGRQRGRPAFDVLLQLRVGDDAAL